MPYGWKHVSYRNTNNPDKQYLHREPCTGSLFILNNSEKILYKIKKTTGIMKSV